MENKIRLVIADDHTLFIQGLLILLQDEPLVEVVDIAGNGKSLLELLRKTKSDIVLLDINMPEMDGIETIRRIKLEHQKLKVIMLSTYNDNHLIEKTKNHGANGYLLKNISKEELIRTILLVHQGQSCFPYQVPSHRSAFDGDDNFLNQYNLSKREKEILTFIKDGRTSQQIADHLHLSIYTIETHRKNILQKLNLHTPVELMKFIMQHNF
jgi:two-component system nitrate/nitrite response regulator NarL